MTATPLGAAPPPTWPPALYNPKPQPHDVLVPLPCGGAMTFRRVRLPSAPPAPTGAGKHLDVLVAALGGADRTLLMGKYEVNQAQAEALSAYAKGRPCPPGLDDIKDSKAMRTLATARGQISWQAANVLGSDLTGWLLTGGRDAPDCPTAPVSTSGRKQHMHEQPAQPPLCVPRVNGQPLPIRLPDAAEWEFAARGGGAVSASDFERSLYPITGAIESHAWVSSNARGEVQPIGQLAANPLGLHDIYGNVAEMLAETRSGETRHGIAPVFVTRGGSRYSRSAALGADREEVEPLYDDRGQLHTSATGVRLVIGEPAAPAPVVPASPRAAQPWSAPVLVAEMRPRLPQGAAPPTGSKEIVTRFEIGTTGAVSAIRTPDSMSPPLRQAIEEAFGEWEFEPAHEGGQPVETSASVRVRFPAGARIGVLAEPLYGDASEPITDTDQSVWAPKPPEIEQPRTPSGTASRTAKEPVSPEPVTARPATAKPATVEPARNEQGAAEPANEPGKTHPAADVAPKGLSVRLFELLRPKSPPFPAAYAWLVVLFSLAFFSKLLQWPGLASNARLSVLAPQLQPIIEAMVQRQPKNEAQIRRSATQLYQRMGVSYGWMFVAWSIDLVFLLWIAFTFDDWSTHLATDGSHFFWIADIFQPDDKAIVLWLVIGLIGLSFTSKGKPLAFFGGIVGLVLLSVIAWWLDWPAYLLVFWMLLILVGTALHLYLLARFRNLRLNVGG